MWSAERGRPTAGSLTFRNQRENVSLFCVACTLTSPVPGFYSSGLLLILLSSHVTNSDRLLTGLGCTGHSSDLQSTLSPGLLLHGLSSFGRMLSYPITLSSDINFLLRNRLCYKFKEQKLYKAR